LQTGFEHFVADESDEGIISGVMQFGGQRLEREPADPIEELVHLLETRQQVPPDAAGVRRLRQRRKGMGDRVGDEVTLARPASIKRRPATFARLDTRSRARSAYPTSASSLNAAV
jgi:hypothetical protein